MRARFARPGRREAITASAQRAPDSGGALLRLNEPWQHRALDIYSTQGECSNPAQYQARAMERIRYFPAVLNDKGIPEESSDPALRALFNRIRSPGGAPGDLGELAGTYARLQFVIGDGRMTVTDDEGEEVWEYLSPLEMRMQPAPGNGKPQEYRRLRALGLQPEELVEAPDTDFEPIGNEARVWRFWRRHPMFTQWADSPIRPIVDDYETLARLKLALAAEASSRAAQRGFFFVPEELSFGPADPTMEENPDEDPLLTEIRDGMARSIQNPGTAEAMAPWIFRGPGVLQTSGGTIPMIDLMGWRPLGPTDRYNEIEPIEEMISLIAGSVDMPKELFTGIGDVSHWPCDEQTEVFTQDRGFVTHEELSAGDIVLSLNHDTGESEWVPLTGVRREFVEEQEMVRLQSQSLDALTTSDHRWPVIRDGERIWTTSDGLRSDDRIIRAVPHAGLPKVPTYDDAFVELVAWFITEGTCSRTKAPHVRVSISQSHHRNPARVAELGSVLTDLYGEPSVTLLRRPGIPRGAYVDPAWRIEVEDRGMTLFHLNKTAYDPILAVMDDQHRKIVSKEFIQALTKEQLVLFLETCALGDGTLGEHGGIGINQRDPERLAPLALAAILAGRPVGFYARERRGGYKDGLQHHLTIPATRGYDVPVNDTTRETYTGVIFCPKVPPTKSFLARRNGKTYYTGNTAWFLGSEGFTQHTGPTLIRFCNDMGSAYLRPAAIDARIENADRVTIWYDPSQAVNHPDESGTALKAQDQGVVSNAWTREKLGAPESAAPSEQERAEWVAIKLRQFPSDLQPEPQTGATPPQKGGTGADVSQGPPGPSTQRAPGNKPPSPQGPSLSAMILGAAMAYVDRGRERAGNKIIRYAQSCDPCQEAMKDVERSSVAAALGPDKVRELIAHKGNEAFLVDGVGAAFAERLRRWNVNGGWPEQLGAMVEQHTWRTLFEAEPPPFPAGFLAACEKAVS